VTTTTTTIGAHNNNLTILFFSFRADAGFQTFSLVDEVWLTHPAVNQTLYTNRTGFLPPRDRKSQGLASLQCFSSFSVFNKGSSQIR
jgi:hypothetical protein